MTEPTPEVLKLQLQLKAKGLLLLKQKGLETPEQIKEKYSSEGEVTPQVNQAFAVSRVGKDYNEAVVKARESANQELNSWATSRSKELQPLIKTDEDVKKYKALFEKEQDAKFQEVSKNFQFQIEPKFKAWEAAAQLPPIQNPNPWEIAGQVASATPFGKPIVDFAKGATSFVVDDLPKTLLNLGMSGQARKFEDIFTMSESESNPISDIPEFQEWTKANYGKISGTIPELAKKFFTSLDPEAATQIKAKVEDQIQQIRSKTFGEIKTQEDESARKMAGSIQNIEDVKSLSDFGSLVASTMGKGIGQIPLSVMTAGASSFLQEKAAIYEQQITKLAAERGITREEVIAQGLDDSSGLLGALAAAGLDYIGAKGVMNLIRSGGLKRLVAGGIEAVTEPTQGIIEEASATAGENVKQTPWEAFKDAIWTKDGLMRRGTEAIGGFAVGGALFSPAAAKQAKAKQATEELRGNMEQAMPGLAAIQDAVTVGQLDITNPQIVAQVDAAVQNTGQDVQQTTQDTGQVVDTTTTNPPASEPSIYGDSAFEGDKNVGIDFDKQTKSLSGLAEPEFTNTSRTLIEQAKSTGQLNEDQARILTAYLNNTSGKNFSEPRLKKFINSFREALRLPNEVRTTDIKQRIDGIKTLVRGIRFGTKQAREVMGKLNTQVMAMVKSVGIPAAKAKILLNRITGFNLGSDLQVARLQNYIEKMASGIAIDNLYNEAASLRTQAERGFSRLPANQQLAIRSLLDINPNSIDGIEDYISVVKDIANYLDGKSRSLDKAKTEATIQRVKGEVQTQKRARLAELGVDVGLDATIQQMDAILAGITEEFDQFSQNATDAQKQERKDSLVTELEYSKLGLDDSEYARQIKAVDTTNLTNSDIAKLIRASENYIVNGSKDGWVVAKAKAQEGAAKTLKENLNPNKVMVGAKFPGTHQFASMVHLFQNAVDAAKLAAYSGMDDLKNSFSRTVNRVDRLAFRLEEKMKQLFPNNKDTRQAIVRTALLDILLPYAEGSDAELSFYNIKNDIEANLERGANQTQNESFAQNNKYALEWLPKFTEGTKTRQEFIDKFKKEYPKEWELYQFKKDENSAIEPDFKSVTEDYHGKPFQKLNDYGGMVVVYTLDSNEVPELPNRPSLATDKPVKVSLANNAIERTNQLSPKQIYTLNGLQNFIRGYEEAVSDIESTPLQLQVREFFKDPRVLKQLGDGGKIIMEQMWAIERAAMRSEAMGTVDTYVKKNYSAALKILNLQVSAFKTGLLSGLSRFGFQYAPPATRLVLEVGPEMVMTAMSKLAENSKLPIFDKLPLGIRDQISGGFNTDGKEYYFSSTDLNTSLNKVDAVQNKLNRTQSHLAIGQALGDVASARLVWVANYLKYLKDSGENVETLDLMKEHEQPNREVAIAYANGMTNIIAGPSQRAELPGLFRSNSPTLSAIKNLMFFMGTFPVMQNAKSAQSVLSAIYGTDKAKALKDWGGILLENTTYKALTFAVTTALTSLGFAIAGEEPEEKKEENLWIKILGSASLDTLPFTMLAGSMGQKALQIGVDKLIYLADDTDKPYMTWKKNGGGLPYDYTAKSAGEAVGDFFGPYVSFLTKSGDAIYELSKIGDNTYKINGKEYRINDTQENTLLVLAMIDFLGATGFEISEIKKIVRGTRRGIQQNAVKKSTAKLPEF